jgi:hypothetical protein
MTPEKSGPCGRRDRPVSERSENQITWATLTLDFPPEVEDRLKAKAQTAGLSLKCYCVHLLLKLLLKDASDVEKEEWRQDFPASLRRNGCG